MDSAGPAQLRDTPASNTQRGRRARTAGLVSRRAAGRNRPMPSVLGIGFDCVNASVVVEEDR